MRAVTGLNFATEVGEDTYAANAVTRALAVPALEAGFSLRYVVFSQLVRSSPLEVYQTDGGTSYDNHPPKERHERIPPLLQAERLQMPHGRPDGPYQHAFGININSF